jgi:Uma2 family endonuclease
VVCGENIRADTYQDKPTIIVEVLSRSTRRIDEGEKLEAYLEIETLSDYLMIEHELAAATVYHRHQNEFARCVYQGLDQTIKLPRIKAELALAAVYAEVEFTPEPEPE